MSGNAPQMPDTLAGRCMCGAVTYAISEKTLVGGLCHCDRCRPQSGTAFSTVIFIHSGALTIVGETSFFDDIGTSGLTVLRRFCPRCGSPLTTEPDLTPALFMVKAGALDSNEWFHPGWELFVGRRRPWVSRIPGAEQYDGNPDI
jgi:hypothetical protein